MGMLTFIESERAERARKEMENQVDKDKSESAEDGPESESGPVEDGTEPGSVEDEPEKKKSTKKSKK